MGPPAYIIEAFLAGVPTGEHHLVREFEDPWPLFLGMASQRAAGLGTVRIAQRMAFGYKQISAPQLYCATHAVQD